MTSDAKTIQIFLPDGQPRGIRIAEITTRIVQAVQVPRSLLDRAVGRREFEHVGVYFLFGESEAEAKPIVYIGQTEDLVARLKLHNAKKEFWRTAVLVISKTHSFTQAHIRFLEWHCIKMATQANRYQLDNGNESSKPHVPEPMEADILDAFETSSVLLSTLGFPVFEPVASPKERRDSRDVFVCTGPDANARGELVEDGFVVFRDSIARAECAPSAAEAVSAKRQPLIEGRVLLPESNGKSYRFSEDYLFSSPSSAAMIVLARSANGWQEWRAKDGRTLDEVKRTPAE